MSAAFAVLTLGVVAPPASAAPDTSVAPAILPGSIWGFEVTGSNARSLGPRMMRALRRDRVNTLIVRPGSLSASRLERIRTLAAGNGQARSAGGRCW